MRALIDSILRYRPLMVVALCAWIAAGIYFFLRLDIYRVEAIRRRRFPLDLPSAG